MKLFLLLCFLRQQHHLARSLFLCAASDWRWFHPIQRCTGWWLAKIQRESITQLFTSNEVEEKMKRAVGDRLNATVTFFRLHPFNQLRWVAMPFISLMCRVEIYWEFLNLARNWKRIRMKDTTMFWQMQFFFLHVLFVLSDTIIYWNGFKIWGLFIGGDG